MRASKRFGRAKLLGFAGLGAAVAGAAGFEGSVWRVGRVALFQSRLAPGGARYEVLAREPLGPDPAGDAGGPAAA